MRAAARPRDPRAAAKLLVVDDHGVSHRRRAELPLLLHAGDLVVANDAATLPASLTGVHLRTGTPIEVRLAGRSSLDPSDVRHFTAIIFGGGDFRVDTQKRDHPSALEAGDRLQLGSMAATIVALLDHARLVQLRFEGTPEMIWEAIARHGHPIQYSHVTAPLAIRDTWTRIAGQPVAFEPPSAGFLLTWSMVRAIRARGATFATITHAAGISSTGDPELDRRLPFDEPYVIPAGTVTMIARTKEAGGCVIAIGTTVVRALEDAADAVGRVTPGPGVATQRLGPHTPLLIVDAIVSGMHEPGTSHYELLRAFRNNEQLEAMTVEAESRGYEGHEFGDSTWITRSSTRQDARQHAAAMSTIAADVAAG
ncbi:MAG TPA: S-adenosylmethionine:tRNA ribosyltransferase-isomerase [Vicinamibacterales bacterium]|nr:S-adenosylmethionine:tRNA ribosyltransferase-isomerase [Vicinamibacterales bacterium]